MKLDITSQMQQFQNSITSVTYVGAINFTCVFECFESFVDSFVLYFGSALEEGLTYSVDLSHISSATSNENQVCFQLHNSEKLIFEVM